MKLFFPFLKSTGLVLPDILYPNNLGYQNITPGVLSSQVLGNFQYNPNIFTIQDKTFIAVFGAVTSNPYFFIYDHATEKVSNLISTGIEFLFYDVHNAPSIMDTGDGRLVMVLNVRGGAQPKTQYIYISGENYDVKNWTLSSSGASDLEYPKLQPFNNGDLYSIERDYNSNAWELVVRKSADLGRTWTTLYIIYRSIANVDLRPYSMQIWIDENDVLKMFIDLQEMDIPEHIYLLYMESVDGGKTWTNKEGTYSQDVSVTTLTDVTILNYIAYQAPAGSFITARGSNEIDGNPFAIGRLNVAQNMGIMYYDGANWQSEEIITIGYTISSQTNGSYIDKVGSTYRLFIQAEISGNSQLCEFQSTDLSNWAFIRQLTTKPSNHSIVKTNSGNNYGSLLVCGSGDGDFYISKI